MSPRSCSTTSYDSVSFWTSKSPQTTKSSESRSCALTNWRLFSSQSGDESTDVTSGRGLTTARVAAQDVRAEAGAQIDHAPRIQPPAQRQEERRELERHRVVARGDALDVVRIGGLELEARRARRRVQAGQVPFELPVGEEARGRVAAREPVVPGVARTQISGVTRTPATVPSPGMKLLLVTLYWPPAGGGGVQRPLKFAQYLPALGIETHVLAPDDPKWIHEDTGLRAPTQAWVHRARYLGPKGRKPAEELLREGGLRARARPGAAGGSPPARPRRERELEPDGDSGRDPDRARREDRRRRHDLAARIGPPRRAPR